MSTQEKSEKSTLTFACENCGSELVYQPGSRHIQCAHCSTQNDIPELDASIEEFDFVAYLRGAEGAKMEEHELSLIQCNSCGASVTVDTHVQSSQCAYCATPFVLEEQSNQRLIKPKSLLPFKLNKEEARAAFKQWVRKLWFAPNALKKAVLSTDIFRGVYVPFWTYDAKTDSVYFGQRGDAYYETERYTTQENGKTVTKTRQVRRIRWRNVSGNVHLGFDDVLVGATKSLDAQKLDALQPWDLTKLEAYDPRFLSGFITERYQVDVEEGFDRARHVMDDSIRVAVRRQIGGDEQRIVSLRTRHSQVRFKHILLPVYVSAYHYKNKLYQFIVNARTGEVQGERPWDWLKITLLILVVIAVIAGIYFGTQ